MSESGLTTATEFHDGSVCPACQQPVRSGEPIHLCKECGAASHQACWRQEEGCTSYFCRKERRADISSPAAITITFDEAERLPEEKLLPPTTGYPAGREGRYPKRFSKMAVLSLIFGVLTSLALAGALMLALRWLKHPGMGGWISLLAVALTGLCWLACVLLAVFALAAIANSSMLRGKWLAVSAILLDIALVVGVPLAAYNVDFTQPLPTNVEFIQPPEALASIKNPVIRRAMRANVVVRTAGRGFMGGMILGSGIIVALNEQRALILTNRHVIDPKYREGNAEAPKKTRIDVIFCGRERVEATVEWFHPAGLDLALLKCHPTDLKHPAATTLKLSAAATIGEKVFAVGNPMDLGWTYTEGVISNIQERVIGSLRTKVYQTQTPINQGNSGGGLYSKGDGSLLGINTWTQDKSVTEGLNFAIAVEAAKEVLLPLVKEKGKEKGKEESRKDGKNKASGEPAG